MDNLPVSAQLVSQKPNAKVSNTASNVDQSSNSSPADAAAENTPENAFGKILAKQVALTTPGKGEPGDVILKDKTQDADGTTGDATSTGVGNQVLFLDPNALPMQKFLASNASATATEKSAFADGVPSAMSAISGKDLPVGNGKAVDIAAKAQIASASDSSEQADSKALTQAFDLVLAEKKANTQQDVSAQNNLPVSQLQAAVAQVDKNAGTDQAALAVPQKVGSENWGSGLGDKVVWMVGNQTRGAEIHLNPPALGPLEVRVSLTDGQASLSFMTHSAAVREAIEAATPRLREMLSDTGIGMGSVSVNVGSFSQQQQPQEQQQGLMQGRTSSSTWLSASDNTDVSSQTFTTFVQPLRGRGMVDYFA